MLFEPTEVSFKASTALRAALAWRYATKAYNPQRQIPADKLQCILDAIWMAPSSSGLQQFEVLIINNRELRAKLRPATRDQRQIEECSHLLVFAAWDTYTPERINKVYDHMLKVRAVEPSEGFLAYRNGLLERYPPRNPQVNFEHAARQSYVALGFGLVAAALEGVDSTPIEGFDPSEYDTILGLAALGLRSAVVMCLGYRNADDDWLVDLKKVRTPKEQFFRAID
ncbi:NAD(P)H-dependent oxidoreductase [Mesorhizobium sp. M0659]|uniref:NAD(P)H-dependent oxidoreductase n=1 Tax=Mesorhizobium sp. M0659 TaxID=2956980 RepID=UPI0033361942